MNNSYSCACCGFLTITDAQGGTFEICPICYWEDDDVQFKDINFAGGANDESLKVLLNDIIVQNLAVM